MRYGGKVFLITSCAATAACGVSTGGLAIRAIPDPAAKVRQGDATLGEARVQLALGNTGLALEAFRKVIRTRGDSADALAGVAACYVAMGRYDIARESYEGALALAPHDAVILRALADVLDPLGLRAEAAMARIEAARSTAANISTAASAPAVGAALEHAKAVPSIDHSAKRPAAPIATIAKAPPIANMSTVTVALPPSRPATPQKAQIGAQPPTGSTALAQTRSIAALSPTVTVELPPARPARQLRQDDLASVLRDLVKVSRAKRLAASRSPQPRLERLSAGEVALVTTNQPIWRPQIVSRSRLSTTVRWIPIQLAGRPNIRVLNAARAAGVAAHARGLLLDRGWRRIEIGDAQQMRATSLVIYPANRSNIGRSLAAQFGFASMATRDSQVLLVLLGRDSVKRNVVRG